MIKVNGHTAGIKFVGSGSTPQSKSVSYLKLQILKTRSVPTDGCFQLCEFKLYQNSNLYDWDSSVSITCNMTAISGYDSSNIIDENINTKFATLDWGSVQTNECNFIINLNEIITLDAHSAYSFITPNDEISRDAVSWKIYGSTDGTNWDLLDERSDINITTERTVETQSFPMQYVGGGGLKMKTKTWTGNGNNQLVLTFEKAPKYVYSAWGAGLNNTRVTMMPFVWGVETSFPCFYMQAGQGLLVNTISYSADLKTATITGADVGAIFNVNGQEYTMWYLDEDDV